MSQLALLLSQLHEGFEGGFLQNEAIGPRRHFFAARRLITNASTRSCETFRPASIAAWARASSSANPGVSFQH
jgi:hypothetical protein